MLGRAEQCLGGQDPLLTLISAAASKLTQPPWLTPDQNTAALRRPEEKITK